MCVLVRAGPEARYGRPEILNARRQGYVAEGRCGFGVHGLDAAPAQVACFALGIRTQVKATLEATARRYANFVDESDIAHAFESIAAQELRRID